MKRIVIALLCLTLMLLLTACAGKSGKVQQTVLREQMDEFITVSIADGSIDEVVETWRGDEAKTRILSYEDLSSENGKLTLGTAINPPFSIYENGHYGGVSIEIVYRFCKAHGYGLEIVGYSDINALVMAVSAEKCDIGATTLTITEERKKSVDYSISYTNNPFIVRVRKGDEGLYSSLDDFSGKTVGVLAGSILPTVVAEYMPDSIQMEYNTLTDILYALSQGKTDVGVTNIVLPGDLLSAFPDLTESVAIPYDNPFGMIYPKADKRSSLKSVLYRTFVENDRWEIFVDGILTTIEVSILSILFGTLLGFAVYYVILRRPKKVSKAILNAVLWLIRCTPAVLFLLIFYYIVFGKSGLGGTAICIAAFTVIFAATFLGCFTSAMSTVDPGQDEVSLALGYTPRQSFFRILLPQACLNLWPNYQNAVISHIKATSIVGYVAVVDVTKASDMIRSNTYDALVPLISAAIFYFAVIWCMTFLVRLIKVRTEPSERSRKRHLKGVNQHD